MDMILSSIMPVGLISAIDSSSDRSLCNINRGQSLNLGASPSINKPQESILARLMGFLGETVQQMCLNLCTSATLKCLLINSL